MQRLILLIQMNNTYDLHASTVIRKFIKGRIILSLSPPHRTHTHAHSHTHARTHFQYFHVLCLHRITTQKY